MHSAGSGLRSPGGLMNRSVLGRALASLLIVATTVVASVGVIAAPASAQNVTLVLYNAQHDAVAKNWADAFTAKTGIQVEVRKGSDLVMANQILQEGDASPADLFITENSPG